MKPNEGYAYCIMTKSSPFGFLTNENDEVLVFDSSEEIEKWASDNQIDLEFISVHEVEVIDG